MGTWVKQLTYRVGQPSEERIDRPIHPNIIPFLPPIPSFPPFLPPSLPCYPSFRILPFSSSFLSSFLSHIYTPYMHRIISSQIESSRARLIESGRLSTSISPPTHLGRLGGWAAGRFLPSHFPSHPPTNPPTHHLQHPSDV